MAPLTEHAITTLFSKLASQDAATRSSFFDSVLDDVNWTVMPTSPMSGTYTSKQSFLDATISVLGNKVLTAPIKMQPHNVVVGPATSSEGKQRQQVVVEMKAVDAQCRNGMKYGMVYCWVCGFIEGKGKDDERKWMIERVRAYVDSDLLTRAVKENP